MEKQWKRTTDVGCKETGNGLVRHYVQHLYRDTFYFRAIFGTVPVLFVADPEFLRLSYIKEFSAMPNRRRNPSFGGAFDSMMTVIEDDHWRHVRNSLTPTFTSGKLKSVSKYITSSLIRFG